VTGATGATGETGATGATGATGSASANNGLTLAPGPTVQLGGVLNQNTGVTFGGANNFTLSLGDNVGLSSTPNLSLGNTAGISATQTANAQFGGSVSFAIRVVNSNYTLADDDYTVLCNNAAGLGGGVVITPPAATASNRGRVYVIKRVNPNISGTNDNCAVANIDGVGGERATPGAESWRAEHRRDGRDHPVGWHTVVDRRNYCGYDPATRCPGRRHRSCHDAFGCVHRPARRAER
jgi:hypothetical protein